jgi:hypothetical protein
MSDEQRIVEIKKLMHELRYEQEKILDKYLGKGVGQWHKIGEWKCKESPVGFCVYNPFEDRALDNCIYCHEPHERK